MPDTPKTPPAAGRPEILAPAGHPDAFLAALAAGADAVYCGLKRFSARMAALNFSLDELSRLVPVAHERGARVYVALNTMLKPGELAEAGRLLRELTRHVRPDALIVQDLSFLSLAKQAAYRGELHLSTLANVSFPGALAAIAPDLGVTRVVLPRELSVDEIRQMAAVCPPGIGLEVFVHGALCYGVSGRCYWSSYLGGKSGLRGRCVQPCRRLYTQGGETRRFFSCQDLSLDVLVKVLAEVDRVMAWKIEGRKKSPHYVYHTVKAYRLLRDFGTDPAARADARKEALRLLAGALGRTANHFRFLPQRPWHPIQTAAQTGSGLMVGNLRGASSQTFLVPRQELLAGDLLRLGYEDDPGHRLVRVRRFVPGGGRLGIAAARRQPVRKDVPVFLIDRRDRELTEALEGMTRRLAGSPPVVIDETPFRVRLPRPAADRQALTDLFVHRMPARGRSGGAIGVWLSGDAVARTPAGQAASVWWWLPPVIWPENESEIASLVADTWARGGRRYVINAPWQASFFNRRQNPTLWAGPFCNAANPLALEFLAGLGAAGAVVSPELGSQDLTALPGLSPLPLGIVVSGSWPLCISRILAEDAASETLLLSPKKEGAWARRYGSDFWLYPDWQIDLKEKRNELQRAGYRFFVHLLEAEPKGAPFSERPGLWNWRLDLP